MGYSAKQRKVKTTVEGASALVKELKAMEDAAASVMMAGAKAGGKIALEDAKRNCPVDTGALKQSLHLTEGKATIFVLKRATEVYLKDYEIIKDLLGEKMEYFAANNNFN